MVAGTTGSHSGLCAKLRGPARYKCCKPPSISRPTACIAPQRYREVSHVPRRCRAQFNQSIKHRRSRRSRRGGAGENGRLGWEAQLQVPELEKAFPVPSFQFLAPSSHQLFNGWLGPSGSQDTGGGDQQSSVEAAHPIPSDAQIRPSFIFFASLFLMFLPPVSIPGSPPPGSSFLVPQRQTALPSPSPRRRMLAHRPQTGAL
ncbi:hypothetical protein BKA56DRAFT_608088 [Ilyonectria sp. MPI-CAGE-AT-0026]|nr:hypothetical protein BKA56DRAFT_608088 [Ilyonectria sp. MPI-CAGE-AT-0026]